MPSAAGGLITAATHSTAAIQTTLSMAAGGGVNATAAETNTVGVATMNHLAGGQFHLQQNQNSQNVVSLSHLIEVNTINTSGDNNLGPDHLAGPKPLNPNYCRQPTL